MSHCCAASRSGSPARAEKSESDAENTAGQISSWRRLSLSFMPGDGAVSHQQIECDKQGRRLDRESSHLPSVTETAGANCPVKTASDRYDRLLFPNSTRAWEAYAPAAIFRKVAGKGRPTRTVLPAASEKRPIRNTVAILLRFISPTGGG